MICATKTLQTCSFKGQKIKTLYHPDTHALPFISLCKGPVGVGQFKSRGVTDCAMTVLMH